MVIVLSQSGNPIPQTLFQFAISCLLVYTVLQIKMIYFPKLTLQKVHNCLLHVD